MGKVFTSKASRFLLLLFISCFLLFTFVSPALAAICGEGISEGAGCCPQDRCSGRNYGNQDCLSGQLCCETCAGPVGNIGKWFKLTEETSVAEVFPTIGSLISTILPNIYILAGLVLFILLLFGGLGIIMGAGGGEPEKVGQGKKAVTAAVIGFALIFASYWIIQIIQTLTGIEIF